MGEMSRYRFIYDYHSRYNIHASYYSSLNSYEAALLKYIIKVHYCWSELVSSLYSEELGCRLSHDNEFRDGKSASAAGPNRDISTKDARNTMQHSLVPDEPCKLSNQQLLCKVQNCHEELSRTSAMILLNTETILKKQFKTIKSGFPGNPTR